ncbi:ABC transporter substrate-binding protein [Marinactinospora rubrisoli]|uniref:ABC transporter substrate-binding protein n=1 Tax=Marinactinospora rubrisoli TaxID=2715399 RepID=A0ABW2KN43_9ACTN
MTTNDRPVNPGPRRRAGTVAALATALALVATGCASGGYGAAGADSETFTYITNTELVTEWDPAASYSNELYAFPNMYETLTRYNPEQQEIEPLLATEWESSSDGRTWTFTLREGVTFQTGKSMDSEAVKAAIERTIEEGAGAAYLWDPVSSIETPDENTVTFKLSRPAPMDLITSASYAAYIYDIPASADDFEATSYGTGPYQVESWEAGSENELTLTRYEDYWGGWDGSHYQTVQYRVVPQASTAAQLMTSGEAHYVRNLPTNLLEPMRSEDGLDVTSTTSWQNLFGMMNTESAPLDDERVRQAVAHAVNYDEIIDASEGMLSDADGVIPEGLLGHSEDLNLRMYDPDRAEELLTEAGYGPDSGEILQLDLTYTEGNETVATVASLMQSQLAAVNIELNIEALPWDSGVWPRAQEENPDDRQDIVLTYWWPDNPEPISWFQSVFRTEEEINMNLSYYSNPELDEMIDEVGEVTAQDEDEAQSMYEEMQSMIIADAPVLLLGDQVYQRAVSSSFEGFVDNPAYPNVVFVYDLQPA